MTFDPSAIQIAGLIVSLLAGTGAIGFFFRYSVRLALVERTAEEAHEESSQNGKDIAATKERVTVVEKTLLEVANSIRNDVSSLKDMVSERFKDMVPRSEQVARWESQDAKMADLKDQLTELREKLDS